MKLKSNWRIFIWVVISLLSLALIMSKGLTYGIDFTGGTELKMQLAAGGEPYVDSVVEILKNRLNTMGLKSTQVLKESDNRHVTIKVSTTNERDLAQIKGIINQTAVFEQLVDGQLCAKGNEIALDTGQQGGAFISGTSWSVYVKTSGEGPERCGKTMEGKAGHMTDIFLDRPSNAFILFDKDLCNTLSTTEFNSHPDDTGYTELSFLQERALIPVVCYTTLGAPEEPAVNNSLLEELSLVIENGTAAENATILNLNETVQEMQRLVGGGKAEVILAANLSDLPQELQDGLRQMNVTAIVKEKKAGQPFHLNHETGQEDPDNTDSWIDVVVGLKSTLSIQEGLTYGNPIYDSVFTGGSKTVEEAKQTAQRFKVWLTSGNLPVKTSIILERPNLPELGQQFLKYAALAVGLAIIMVAAIIAIRYRKSKISIFIMLTCFSEAVIILGFASLSSWELDMAAMAGIIAAIGTGVDHQIIITDETLSGERKREKSQVLDFKEAIGRAFFIIFTSAATVVFAMLPLMSIVDLKGFAFTTIVGVLIGIFITRPAYARIIEVIT